MLDGHKTRLHVWLKLNSATHEQWRLLCSWITLQLQSLDVCLFHSKSNFPKSKVILNPQLLHPFTVLRINLIIWYSFFSKIEFLPINFVSFLKLIIIQFIPSSIGWVILPLHLQTDACYVINNTVIIGFPAHGAVDLTLSLSLTSGYPVVILGYRLCMLQISTSPRIRLHIMFLQQLFLCVISWFSFLLFIYFHLSSDGEILVQRLSFWSCSAPGLFVLMPYPLLYAWHFSHRISSSLTWMSLSSFPLIISWTICH